MRRALEAHGYSIGVSQEALGQAVVACQTPECVEQALDAAEAEFAIVPALWVREAGGEELTLTLVQRSGRSLNASAVLEGELDAVAAGLVDELLERRDAQVASAVDSGAGASAAAVSAPAATGSDERPRRPNAWKAGPIVLMAAGASAFVAIGVAAGIKSDSQQLNETAVLGWSVVGAAAIAGGAAWLVIGKKNRRARASQKSALPELGLGPMGFDLRLRF